MLKPSSLKLRGTIAVAVAGSLTLLTACGQSGAGNADSDSENSLHYAAVLPLSGPLSAIGEADKAAVQAAVDVVNANGGANGKPVALTFIDSTGTSTEAVSALQKALASGEKIDFVHAGATSTEALPMLPILSQRKVPSCTTASATPLNDPKKYPYAFGNSALSSFVAEAMVSSLKELGYTKVAGIYPSTELGHAAKQAATEATKSAGIELATVDADPTATDLTSQFDQLKSENPQALVVDGFGPIAGVMLKTRAKMGWNIPVVGDDTFAVNNLGKLVDASALEGVSLSTLKLNVAGTPVTESEDFKEYQQALAKYVKEPTFAAEVYGTNYQCVTLAVAAANRAKSTDPDKLKSTIESFQTAADVPGWFLTEKIGYSAETHFPEYNASEYTTVPAGPRVNGLLVPKK